MKSVVWVLLAVVTMAEMVFAMWGGNASGSFTDSRTGGVSSQIADQQYLVHIGGYAASMLRYQAFLRFRRLQTETETGGSTWRNESQPSITATWANPLYTMRGEYSTRDYRNRDQSSDLTGRTFSSDFQTSLQGLPRLRSRYEWTKNISNLEVYGRDTRLERFTAGASYIAQRFSASYDYSERRLRNRSGLATATREHEGRADYSLSLLKRAVTVSSSYRGVFRRERQQSPFDPATLLPMPASAGLYAQDPTPDFGELGPAGGLIDGNVENPASPEMDLSSSAYHNFGLDFGSATTVDRLFLITDSLANEDQRFAVYASSDNLSWTEVRGYRPYRFDVVFLRYELDFPRQFVRYIKIVAEPSPRSFPVYVNELRAYLSRDAQIGPVNSDDQQGVVDLRIRPWSWLQLGMGGSLQRAGRSQTQLAREQDGANASLAIAPAAWIRLSSHYQLSRTAYPGAGRERTRNDLESVTLETKPLSTIISLFSVGRQREWIETDQFRRADHANARATLQIFPDLTSSTDLSYVEDHRFLDDNLLFTRSVGQSFDGHPNDRSSLAGEYRIYRLQARRGGIPRKRVSLSVRGSYQLTRTVTVRADADHYEEGHNRSLISEGGLSWTATPKLQLTGSVNRALYDEGTRATLMTGQAFYRATSRADASLSYTHNHYDNDVQPASSNLRLALNINF